MNKTKHYRDSLLSALCIISWVIIVFRIFTSPGASDNNHTVQFIWIWIITITIGIIGGVCLHFYSLIKKRILRQTFIYNFFATLNIIAGSLGMMLSSTPGTTTPYLIAASFTVGIIMYKNIYTKRKWLVLSKKTAHNIG